jgi:hypothetical protein
MSLQGITTKWSDIRHKFHLHMYHDQNVVYIVYGHTSHNGHDCNGLRHAFSRIDNQSKVWWYKLYNQTVDHGTISLLYFISSWLAIVIHQRKYNISNIHIYIYISHKKGIFNIFNSTAIVRYAKPDRCAALGLQIRSEVVVGAQIPWRRKLWEPAELTWKPRHRFGNVILTHHGKAHFSASTFAGWLCWNEKNRRAGV